jgi:hypothetical protein
MLPATATERHKDSAQTKLANCLFGKHYILAFQKRYGELDPEDKGPGGRKFLQDFAGEWAARFGSNDGPGSFTEDHVEEWMTEVKHHNEL